MADRKTGDRMSERLTNQNLRRLGLAVALLVGAEALAQFVAWRVWSTEWIAPAGGVEPATVLLVGAGECYDEGVASREDAWPARTVAELEGEALRLVSGAAPGRDSEDLLRRLPLQLSVDRPGRVVVCVGVEDFRQRQASPVDVAADLPGQNAPFEVRPRLWSALFGGDEEVAATLQGPAQLHGAWHFGDLEFRFEPDGGLWMGLAPALWTYGEDEIGIEVPGVGSYRAAWRIEGQQLHLEGNFPGEQVLLVRGPNPGGAAALGAGQLDAGRFDEAEWMLRPAVVGSSGDLDAAVTLVELLRRAGRDDEASALARQVLDGSEGDAHAGRRARLHLLMDEPTEALAAIGADLAPFAGDALLLRTLRRADTGTATEGLAAAAARGMRGAEGQAQRELAFVAAELLDRAGDRDAAVVALCSGFAAVPVPPDHRTVPSFVRELGAADWDSATAGAGIDLAVFRAVRSGVEAADAATARILDANLRSIVALVRFYGAEPILLDPDDDRGARGVRQQVGRDLGVTVVTTGRGRDELAAGLRKALGR